MGVSEKLGLPDLGVLLRGQRAKYSASQSSLREL